MKDWRSRHARDTHCSRHYADAEVVVGNEPARVNYFSNEAPALRGVVNGIPSGSTKNKKMEEKKGEGEKGNHSFLADLSIVNFALPSGLRSFKIWIQEASRTGTRLGCSEGRVSVFLRGRINFHDVNWSLVERESFRFWETRRRRPGELEYVAGLSARRRTRGDENIDRVS